MTIREKLILMDDIKRKNDTTWSRYAHTPRRYWTWEADVKSHFVPLTASVANSCLQCAFLLCWFCL